MIIKNDVTWFDNLIIWNILYFLTFLTKKKHAI